MVCKVVSIEDEPEIAELLRIVLSSPQIEVYSCDNGPDGINLIKDCKPELVILDIMLPGMNGWAVYDAIRADEDVKATPIVMLSVLREAPERRQAFVGSPIDLYVTKPFDTLRLRSDIERMLGRKGLWPTTKPLITRPEETKPVEIRVEETKPAEVHSEEAKPIEEAKPVETLTPSGNGSVKPAAKVETVSEEPRPTGDSKEQTAPADQVEQVTEDKPLSTAAEISQPEEAPPAATSQPAAPNESKVDPPTP